jgi:hypothetical protein
MYMSMGKMRCNGMVWCGRVGGSTSHVLDHILSPYIKECAPEQEIYYHLSSMIGELEMLPGLKYGSVGEGG